ncbi:MAG: homocysteine S-methyltransferase family protein, partial [Spirochaetaceae bacterium]|nr:homocysteine S-methyltransferase family protein [Spirochaetaceae bacterium]
MTTREKLDRIAARRVIILDGAMGTEIQRRGLTVADFRAARFAAHGARLSGCNDVLCLTRPALIREIHESYLEAGADIIETCSFSATSIALAEYGLAEYAYEISRESARIACCARDAFSTAEKPRFTAGVMGPL